jgi:chromosome segregation ATPase
LLEEGYAALGPDHPLVERIAGYEANDPRSRIPELYAILGTETAELPAALEEHYATYFSDRSKVVALSETTYSVFDSLSAELLALSDELESRNAEIEGLRYTYGGTSASLRADVLAFNAKAAEPGVFPSKSEFEAVREGLISRQARLETMRVTLQTKINEYNTLLEELNTLNDEVSELNQGINVTLEAKDELAPDESGLEE